MAFTAADVKKLREMTNVGMMDCTKALAANDGDMDKAVEWLREKGLAKAAKKSSRIAAEGMADAVVEDGIGVFFFVFCSGIFNEFIRLEDVISDLLPPRRGFASAKFVYALGLLFYLHLG